MIPNILPPKSAIAAVEAGVGCQVQHEPIRQDSTDGGGWELGALLDRDLGDHR